MKHTFNLSCDVEAESEECGRTMIYQALLDTATGLMFHDKTPNAPSFSVAFQSKRKRKENEQFWQSLDWEHKCLEELSIETGICQASLAHKRRTLYGAHSPLVKRKPRAFQNTNRKLNPQELDWSKKDIELAKEHGVSRERIRQLRKRGNHPASPKAQSQTLRLAEMLPNRWDEVKHLKIEDMAITLGVNEFRLYKALSICGYKPVKTAVRHPWHLLNFDIGNTVLQGIWNISRGNICNYKLNKGIPEFKWNGVMRRAYPDEYKSALEQEIIKAEQWRANNPQPNKGER